MNDLASFRLQPAPVDVRSDADIDGDRKIKLSRRSFFTISAAVGGGLMLELVLLSPARAATLGSDPSFATGKVTIVIGTDNSVTLVVPGGEMGQGINGGLAQAFAEELPLDFNRIKTVPAPYGTRYGNGPYASQVTGGSTGMRNYFDSMMQSGATARALLVAAAAQISPSSTGFRAVAGSTDSYGNWTPNAVVDSDGTRWSYGELASTAARAL